MEIKDVAKDWDCLGRRDALWAVKVEPGKKGNRWQTREFFETGEADVKSVLSDLAQNGIQPLRKRALDFGCAVGRLTQALALYFEEVWGADIAPSMIELARQYNQHPSRCKFQLIQQNLGFWPDGHFDFVISLIVLQHSPQQYLKNYLKEFLRVLAPDGVLVFQLPSEWNPQVTEPKIKKWLRHYVKPLVPSAALKAFRIEELMKMYATPMQTVVSLLDEAGGEVVAVKQDGRAGEAWISLEYMVRKKP